MTKLVIHFIEPTLADLSGHCYQHVNRLLLDQSEAWQAHVWLDRCGSALKFSAPCQVHPYFRRRWRKLQQYICLKKLLRRNETIFISTAGQLDLVYADRILGNRKASSPIIFHFHQYRVKAKKLDKLRTIAKCHPEFVIVSTTDRLSQLFRDAGFSQVFTCDYPAFAAGDAQVERSTTFNRVLYAGAARSDKGFPEVVDWLKHNLPEDYVAFLQASLPANGRYDMRSEQALQQLRSLQSNSNITVLTETLTQPEYNALFEGAIVLLPYDASYRNKVSGVLFDALQHGCPVIVTADTWMADIVQQYDVGLCLADSTPENIERAIATIRADFSGYQARVWRAVKELRQRFSARTTWDLIHRLFASK